MFLGIKFSEVYEDKNLDISWFLYKLFLYMWFIEKMILNYFFKFFLGDYFEYVSLNI